MFRKILIANRGEIAVRIIRACREMGIATVAVFSEADAPALFVSMADESICIGGPRAADSYLNMEAILSAAIATGAEAIHPGYGLLSENPKFVAMCEQCGIAFIGPTSELIAKMGDKDEARRTMKAAGVPVIPGSDVIEDVDEAERCAEEIGFPATGRATLRSTSARSSTSRCRSSATTTGALFASESGSARSSGRQDYFIPPFYDSMIGKLIVHAQNREQAIRKMKMALSELVIEGVTHNADFQAQLLENPAFVDGSYTTGLLDELGK